MFFIREEIIRAFERGIFSYVEEFEVEKESNEESDEESDQNKEIDTTDIPNLESEEHAVERRKQKASGLKILTPNQILSRLPILFSSMKYRKKF